MSALGLRKKDWVYVHFPEDEKKWTIKNPKWLEDKLRTHLAIGVEVLIEKGDRMISFKRTLPQDICLIDGTHAYDWTTVRGGLKTHLGIL